MKTVSDAMLRKLWGKVCILQAGSMCEYPDCKVHYTQLHPHHFFSKKNQSVRYDPLNSVCLCAFHHTLGNEAAHLDPFWKDIWLSSGKRPDGWIEELTIRKNKIVKNNNAYRLYWYETLTLILKILEEKNGGEN